MAFRRLGTLFLLATTLFATTAIAQTRSEVFGVIGRPFLDDHQVPNTNFFDNTVHFGSPISFEVGYARTVLGNESVVALTLELPVLFTPNVKLNYGINTIPESYSAFFVAPSVRARIFASNAVSPWVSFGGGFAYFSKSDTLVFGGPNPGEVGTTTGVYQIGGGLDVRILRSLSLRGEARDYNSGVPQLNVDYGQSRQNNLFVGGGVVFHF